MPKFEVAFVYKGQNNYIVEADNADAAMEVAQTRYDAGEDGESTGAEWQEVENIVVKEI